MQHSFSHSSQCLKHCKYSSVIRITNTISAQKLVLVNIFPWKFTGIVEGMVTGCYSEGSSEGGEPEVHWNCRLGVTGGYDGEGSSVGGKAEVH